MLRASVTNATFLVSRCLPPVTQRFRHVDAADLFGAREVGDSSGNAEDAVEASRREAHRRGSVCQKLAPGLIGRCHAIEQLAVGFCVGSRPVPIVALRLHLASRSDPFSNFRAAFGWRREREIGCRYPRYFDMEIDAIEQWP